MKICPKCQRTYTDENLNFCLDDGTVLAQTGGGAMPPTVMMNQPRITAPAQSMPSQQMPQPAWNTGQPQNAAQPKKSSKMWIWVVVVLGGLALLCGGGFIAFLAYVGSQAEKVSNIGNYNGTNPSPSPGKTNSTTPTTGDRNTVEKADLSKWVVDDGVAITEMKGSDFILATKQKGYYYVVAAPEGTFETEEANTSVTVKNVDDANSRLGYGIVFHSNPRPLQQDYAFLIDSKKQKYRVIHHSPGKEQDVIGWTKSDAIRDGSQGNKLEVRDLTDKIELYINDKLVNSIKNVYGYKDGVVGLYSGDAVKAAFSNLEIRKK